MGSSWAFACGRSGLVHPLEPLPQEIRWMERGNAPLLPSFCANQLHFYGSIFSSATLTDGIGHVFTIRVC